MIRFLARETLSLAVTAFFCWAVICIAIAAGG